MNKKAIPVIIKYVFSVFLSLFSSFGNFHTLHMHKSEDRTRYSYTKKSLHMVMYHLSEGRIIYINQIQMQ